MIRLAYLRDQTHWIRCVVTPAMEEQRGAEGVIQTILFVFVSYLLPVYANVAIKFSTFGRWFFPV